MILVLRKKFLIVKQISSLANRQTFQRLGLRLTQKGGGKTRRACARKERYGVGGPKQENT
jgi:hypothetical protein